MGGFLILIVILVGAVGALRAAARAPAQPHAAMQDTIEAGDEIITAGGLHGTVVEIVDDTAKSRSRPASSVTLDRRAIAAVAREVDVEVEPDAEAAPDPGADEPDAEKPETTAEPG